MNKILILLFILLPFLTFSQGYKYFNKSHDHIVDILILNKNIEIMEDYPDYIHAVDDVKLNNLIFYLRDDKCYEFHTTYQKENDYDKVFNYLDVVYIRDEESVWHFDFDSGRQITYLQKKPGFFVTKDIFVPKEK
jgi:hypothetical protein